MLIRQPPLRFGILGAAHIVPNALIKPARQIEEVEVVAIAARDPARAHEFALAHHIPRVLQSYDAVIDASEIDAIYIPLPNSLHCEWAIRALRAGKHVLCEKPLASNAREAEQMAEVAEEARLVLAEALHYRYHPLAARVYKLLQQGTIGRLRRFECHFSVPSLPANIRFDWNLAGGATMDLGCYLLDMIRYFSGLNPHVRRAKARVGPPRIDLTMEAELELEDGALARMSCSMAPETSAGAWFYSEGENGQLLVTNLIAPHGGHLLTIKSGREEKREIVEGHATYVYQLRAFTAAVHAKESIATSATEGILNMRLIDEVYRAAGLPIRGT
jgi:predicted dehydrogenase